MVHVWITPHPCGVFAALEGVGAGQTAVPEDQRVDMCNQPHDHAAAPVVAPKPYDPTQPIDLGGVAGVTPEQQAAAENLIALNVVRLPQWSDYRIAEAAGFHSIGDALTGHEHFIQWDLDQRRRLARPRPAREPGVRAATRRLEEVGQRDVHAARHGGTRPTCPTSAAR